MEKLCLFCKEFEYEPGEPDWSEVTPGDDAVMRCKIGIFEIDLYEDTLQEYRRKILTARNCAHYEFSNEIENLGEE